MKRPVFPELATSVSSIARRPLRVAVRWLLFVLIFPCSLVVGIVGSFYLPFVFLAETRERKP